MDAHLNSVMAREHRADLTQVAQASRLGDSSSPTPQARRRPSLVAHVVMLVRRHRHAEALRLERAGGAAGADAVTLRVAVAADFPALIRLAALDSNPVPRHPVLLAVAGRELRAAISLADGLVAADPFRRTDGLVALLRERARQLDRERRDARAMVAATARTTSSLALRAARSQ